MPTPQPSCCAPTHLLPMLGHVWWENVGTTRASGQSQELQGGAGTRYDVGTQVLGLMTPSSCREGLGSGWWAVAVAGGKGGEPRALAVPPLTHSPVETETFPRLTPADLQHPSLAMAGCTCEQPFPGSTHGTARHGAGREQAGSRGLSWLALLSLVQGLSPSP